MKKRLIGLILLLSIFLTGCTGAKINSVTDNKDSMFVSVERTAGWYIVYHKDTKVMYAVSSGSYNCGNFTLLVDENGDPLLYE